MMRALTLVVCICLCCKWTMGKLNGDNPKYSNIWAAKIQGGEEVAKMVARDLGFIYKGQLGQLEDYYELVREDHPEVSLQDSSHLTRSLMDHDEVKWAKQQLLVRPVTHQAAQYDDVVKFIREDAMPAEKVKEEKDCETMFSCLKLPENIQSYASKVGQDISKLGSFPTKPLPEDKIKTYNLYSPESVKLLQSEKISAYVLMYNDPFWGKQWNMQDYRTRDMPVKDLNVVPVHKMGYSGKGVTVTVLDDGVEHDNPDLVDNFLADLSYNTCENKPGSWPNEGHSIGTKSAGVIAMAANNEKCGVGIAYKANIVGINVMCRKVSQEIANSKALVHHIDKIDIYSNSWGVFSKGRFWNKQEKIYRDAYRNGITEGRQGKGAIYIHTAGNDKTSDENCAVNPALNNPYVMTIAGADQMGKETFTSERCGAVFATAYTSNKNTEGIVAPELKGGCTANFEGTSAAPPQAAGIVALTLEANPDLTYRDVMHLITMSAEVAPLAINEKSWYKNGRKFWVSRDFGFGLLNAENMVVLAKDWQNVPELHVCNEPFTIKIGRELGYERNMTAPFISSGCQGTPSEVNYVEHVEIISKVDFPRRGNIIMYLTSPAGITTQLLEPRTHDDNKYDLDGWSIVTTQNWGEAAQGLWNVVFKVVDPISHSIMGKVVDVNLVLYGTKDMPAHYAKPREYSAFLFPKGSPKNPTKNPPNNI